MRNAITIAGSLAQKPHQGGHSWVLLQYLLGFKRLGWKVLFLDALTPEMCFGPGGRPCSLQHSMNWRLFREVMERFGLQNEYSLVYDGGAEFIGMPRRRVLEHVGDSAFLINIMGFLENEEILGRAPRRVFLDIDPGFAQIWATLGLVNLFDGYDHHVTIGQNIGTRQCVIPTCGLPWITTRQPIVLSLWPARVDKSLQRITSIITWRGAYDPVTYLGHTYGLRAHEFRKFASLPVITDQRFELALNIHPEDSKDLDLLQSNRWDIANPIDVAADPWSYRSYIQTSSAELMIAKNIYVDTHSGWFSDRSICYLASGKPVLAQNTGVESLYPSDHGLLLFDTLEEAVARVGELQSDYQRHASNARAIAEDYFDSDLVLTALLDKLGVARCAA